MLDRVACPYCPLRALETGGANGYSVSVSGKLFSAYSSGGACGFELRGYGYGEVESSESEGRSVMSDSVQPHGLYVAHQAPLSMGLSRQECWSE